MSIRKYVVEGKQNSLIFPQCNKNFRKHAWATYERVYILDLCNNRLILITLNSKFVSRQTCVIKSLRKK